VKRLLQDCGDHVRQLHRALDLVFASSPTTYEVSTVSWRLPYLPTTRQRSSVGQSLSQKAGQASLRYEGRHHVGETLAQELHDAAKSVGRYQSESYQLRIRYACEDIIRLRQRLHKLEADSRGGSNAPGG